MNLIHLNALSIPSETIERKFTDIQPTNEWEVESESGWEEIESINKTIPYQVYKVIFSNGTMVECADTHIFIDENHSEVFAKDSLHSKIISREGPLEVVEVSPTQKWEEMYDLTVDSKDHTYFGNGVLSHNSETTAACVLWYMLFQEYKTVAVLANKASTARIILGRIQSMYENLPKWMQVGVVEWNKGSFQLGNHNRCFGAATGGSAIRGCISGNSLVEIKENDIVKKVSIQNLFENILDSKGDTAINSGSLLVNSPNGWSNFDSLVRYEYDQFLNIKTDSGNLKVSLNHPIFTENGWENAENLKIGDILIKKKGKAKIVDIEKVNDTFYLYDFLNVNN